MDYGNITIYDNGLKINQDDYMIPTIIHQYNISYRDLIQKDKVEEIARDVLNNSKILMKGKQPFVAPTSESNRENDNIGNNYEIDTKLLFMQSACFKISKDEKNVICNNLDFDYLYYFYDAYKGFIRKKHPKNKTQENQYEIINKIISILEKNRDKNLLFIFPVPQLDLFMMNNLDFSKSFFWEFFWGLGQIKKLCKFKKDIYFAYPLINNDYNLVKIGIKNFVCEPMIKSDVQKKYLCATNFGGTINKRFYPFTIKIVKPRDYVFKFRYKKYHFDK